MIQISPFTRSRMEYGSVGQALMLVFYLMSGLKTWAESTFELWYAGEPFGTGFVMEVTAGSGDKRRTTS